MKTAAYWRRKEKVGEKATRDQRNMCTAFTNYKRTFKNIVHLSLVSRSKPMQIWLMLCCLPFSPHWYQTLLSLRNGLTNQLKPQACFPLSFIWSICKILNIQRGKIVKGDVQHANGDIICAKKDGDLQIFKQVRQLEEAGESSSRTTMYATNCWNVYSILSWMLVAWEKPILQTSKENHAPSWLSIITTVQNASH